MRMDALNQLHASGIVKSIFTQSQSPNLRQVVSVDEFQ